MKQKIVLMLLLICGFGLSYSVSAAPRLDDLAKQTTISVVHLQLQPALVINADDHAILLTAADSPVDVGYKMNATISGVAAQKSMEVTGLTIGDFLLNANTNNNDAFGFTVACVKNFWNQSGVQNGDEGVVQPTDFVVNLTTNIMANHTNTMTADDHDEGCYQISVSSSTGALSQTLHQQSQHPLLC